MPTRESTRSVTIGLGGVTTRTVGPPPGDPWEPVGDIHYGTGSHGDIIITQSDVLVTADSGATFSSIQLRGVDKVVMLSLTVTGTIFVDAGVRATNCIVRDCTVAGVYLNTARTTSGIQAPSGWLIEYCDINSPSGYCLLVKAHGSEYPYIQNTTIRYNKLTNPNVDAIQAGWYDGLTIHDNEFSGVIENGNHNDAFQSVFGGKNLTFTNNYLHHNRCQPFFLKDGIVEGVEFSENLSIYNREAGDGSPATQFYRVTDANIHHNTIWDSAGFRLRSGQGVSTNIDMHRNVINDMYVEVVADYQSSAVIVEDYNVFGGGWSWVPGEMGANSIEDASPSFDDWRIADYGITWQPTGRLYGRAAYTG